MNKFDEMREAVREAENVIDASSLLVRKTASLAAGRLRLAECYHDDLCDLKKELANYNMTTGKWK